MLISPTIDWILVWLARLSLWMAAFSIFAIATVVAMFTRDPIVSYVVPKPESIETAITPKFPSGFPSGMAPGTSRPPAANDDLKFETPAGWTATQGNQFSLKAFEVVKGDEKIEITVSAAGGDMLANMNRWRGQIGASELTEDELAKAFQPREVNGKPAMFIEMHSPEQKQSILGIVVPEGDRTWFIKLRGATSLAEQERQRLEEFAKSLTW